MPPTKLGGQATPRAAAPPPRSDLGGRSPLPPSLYKGRGWEGRGTPAALAQPLPLPHLLLLPRACRSSVGVPQLPPPPHRRAVGDLPRLLLPPCWIKKEETSPGCTCVERGGAVRSALGRIYRDLNRFRVRLHQPRSS